MSDQMSPADPTPTLPDTQTIPYRFEPTATAKALAEKYTNSGTSHGDR